MADIIQIYPTQTDKSLVLDIGESRAWTVENTNYSKIKAAVAISLVKEPDLNHVDAPFAAESLDPESIRDFRKYFCFGFKYSNEGFPSSDRQNKFIGYTNGLDNYGDATTVAFTNTNTAFGSGVRYFNYSRLHVSIPSLPKDRFQTDDFYMGHYKTNISVSPVNRSLASLLLIELTPVGGNFNLRVGNVAEFDWGPSETFFSKSRMQQALVVPFNVVGDWSSSDAGLPNPDQVFIYSPFLTYRLAIHAFALQVTV